MQEEREKKVLKKREWGQRLFKKKRKETLRFSCTGGGKKKGLKLAEEKKVFCLRQGHAKKNKIFQPKHNQEGPGNFRPAPGKENNWVLAVTEKPEKKRKERGEGLRLKADGYEKGRKKGAEKKELRHVDFEKRLASRCISAGKGGGGKGEERRKDSGGETKEINPTTLRKEKKKKRSCSSAAEAFQEI